MAFPNWPQVPIPGVSLSASGILALADLSTIAQRTAITGGSSWLDSLLLAPGLHYQQAAEQLAIDGGAGTHTAHTDTDDFYDGANPSVVVEGHGKSRRRIPINNAATAAYIRRIANSRPGETVTLDVGWGGLVSSKKKKIKMKRSDSGGHAFVWAEEGQKEQEHISLDLGWVSHLLYLASPVLTVIAAVLLVLEKDWWALAQMLGLMISRLFNIWVIKQRTKRQQNQKPEEQEESTSEPTLSPSPMSRTKTSSSSSSSIPKEPITYYIISLSPNTSHNTSTADSPNEPPTSVRLRGKPSDLEAITSSTWLRHKTNVEGYLEAMAKLIVYGTAAFSGNTTQIGEIIMMGLLLVTAGLLALSNANARSLTVNGRVVVHVDGDGDDGGCGGRKKGMGNSGKGRAGANGKEMSRTGGVIEGEAVPTLEAGGKRRKEGVNAAEEHGRADDDNSNYKNRWSGESSPSSGHGRGASTGQVGLSVDGIDDIAADRAEKGEMRHSSDSGSFTS
ncbi:hypothetical protein V8F20_000153 [Naviculisporaceae sp. PSN 640]